MLTYMRMLEGSVTESKKLGCFGASYLYPILMSIGICGNKTAALQFQPQSATVLSSNTKELFSMSRPKGSKNKVTLPANIDEQIANVNAEIEELAGSLKAKKAELKKLMKDKVEADRIAAEKKAEEDRQRIIEAVEASGKTVDEILEMLK